MEDEIKPESEDEVDMKVTENREEPSEKDNATQLVDNQGTADRASRQKGLEEGDEDISCFQVKKKRGRVSSCKVPSSTKAECPVLCSDKVIYSAVLMQDILKENHCSKDWVEEFEGMEIEKADVVAEEKPNKLGKAKNVVIGGVGRTNDTDVSSIEELKNRKRTESNLHVGSTVEPENVEGVALENVNCAKGRVKSIECSVQGCGKMSYSRRPMEDHMRRTHGVEKLSCPRPGCEVKFVSWFGHQRHIKNAHHRDEISQLKIKDNQRTQESPVNQLVKQANKRAGIKCKVEGCQIRFSPYNERKEDHMRKEHGQSKLICQMCEASYFSRDGFNRHMKKAHKGKTDDTEHKIGAKRDNATSSARKVGDMSPIAVKVQEPEVEVLDMEIF